MAKGWESKSVEEQQAEFAAARTHPAAKLTPEQMARERLRQGLLLSCKHIVAQLEMARNSNHRKVLENALQDLQAKLAELG